MEGSVRVGRMLARPGRLRITFFVVFYEKFVLKRGGFGVYSVKKTEKFFEKAGWKKTVLAFFAGKVYIIKHNY